LLGLANVIENTFHFTGIAHRQQVGLLSAHGGMRSERRWLSDEHTWLTFAGTLDKVPQKDERYLMKQASE
jgi:hypothetical protein